MTMEYENIPANALEIGDSILVMPSNIHRWYYPEEEIHLTIGGYEATMNVSEISITKISPNKIKKAVLGVILKPFYAKVQAFENGVFKLSHRDFLIECHQKIEVGKVYDATIYSISNWGLYCYVQGATVLVRNYEVSTSRFYQLDKIFAVGENIRIKILSKQDSYPFFIEGSRKLASAEEANFYTEGDIVSVIISGSVNANGYFCEITPYQTGIMDTSEFLELQEGERCSAIIKSIRYSADGNRLVKLRMLL